MPPHDYADRRSESVTDAVTAMKLESDRATDTPALNGGSTSLKDDPNGVSRSPSAQNMDVAVKSRSSSQTPVKKEEETYNAADMEEKVGGDITVKQEPGQPPKLTRSSSQKVVARPPQLFSHLRDSTAEARASFELMDSCTYANKYMGYTEHAMECDCAEEWVSSLSGNILSMPISLYASEPALSKNLACGDDSDCINRATKIECVGDCGCGPDCQNQRFQRKEYAQVAVIKTEKKGFGLRAEANMRPHQFIYEYVGEVINEGQFRRRMRQYDEEGIKHFYFMSLSKGEFVDATKRGNLGRFCNHSCNPNCYVDKWVVGEKLRMGIFAERDIQAGEELVFNYNVDRYGADPQPCYCGEPNCTGFIGGRTQTERATKLSNATIEALGIEDADGWDTAVAKRPRKKKMGEDDEEYVDSVQPKSLEENGVTKVMAALMQCQEKWIAVKLLGRIQRCDDERVRNRVVKMHGYQILNSQLTMWKDDFNVVLQILDILDKFPRLTRNKIIDSKIEVTIQPLTSCGDERVEKKAATLLQVWSTLEVGYRIPRMKRDPNATAQAVNQFERRETIRDQRRRSKSRSRSRSRSIEAPRGPAAQTRGVYGQRNTHHHGPRSFRRQFNPLPTGWFAAESNGRTYYYSARGDTTWTRPTKPAPQPPPPPKESRDKALQDIIDGIMNAKENTPKEKSGTPGTPQVSKPIPVKKEGQEKWRGYSEDKQKKVYENTLFPHIKYVVDKFKHKLPKEDLKRYAKDVAKKLVNSDFKNNRVEDPTKISEKQQKKVKKYCKEFFDKAVLKHRAYEQRKSEKQAKGMDSKVETPQAASDDEALDVEMSDDEEDKADEKDTPMTAEEPQGGTKRKREGGIAEDSNLGEYISSSKRQRSSTPPPPPPISPGDDPQNMDNAKKILRDNIDSRSENNEFTPPPPPPPPPDDEIPSESPETDHTIDQSPSKAEYITDMNKLKSSQPEIEGKV
ncbi:histone-lysine N-methyltransferase, H3 lysine-36 specific [Aspergillus transmontanensis]|uniref:Histone-lysine N-methyltransferase, H3 lysine-36 specific n=1 Tax=Aspergillus transmontanensis TaxID=1034304 RepID=A0A5N6WC94_9EURO|nr:histone-lysine N-methyltransferase, H3 lysine-36 specific [Aspergillus transmontanensis]